MRTGWGDDPPHLSRVGTRHQWKGVYTFKCKLWVLATVLAFPALWASPSLAADPVDLRTAGNFAALAKTGIETTSGSEVVGDLGVSPIEATGLTGFGLILDSSGEFATSSLVTGRLFAADYAVPTPTKLTTAVGDMETAYTDAAGRAPDVVELGAGNIGGMTLSPGVYKWSSGLLIPTDVTLSGNANDIWIFQIAGTLGISSDTAVVLSGDAQASNIYWQVADQVTLGTGSAFSGTILGMTAIVLNDGAMLDGSALAQSAVTLNGATVVPEPGATLGAVTALLVLVLRRGWQTRAMRRP